MKNMHIIGLDQLWHTLIVPLDLIFIYQCSIPLERSQVDSMRRARFLQRLKEIHAELLTEVVKNLQGDDSVLLSESEVPLQQQV